MPYSAMRGAGTFFRSMSRAMVRPMVARTGYRWRGQFLKYGRSSGPTARTPQAVTPRAHDPTVAGSSPAPAMEKAPVRPGLSFPEAVCGLPAGIKRASFVLALQRGALRIAGLISSPTAFRARPDSRCRVKAILLTESWRNCRASWRPASARPTSRSAFASFCSASPSSSSRAVCSSSRTSLADHVIGNFAAAVSSSAPTCALACRPPGSQRRLGIYASSENRRNRKRQQGITGWQGSHRGFRLRAGESSPLSRLQTELVWEGKYGTSTAIAVVWTPPASRCPCSGSRRLMSLELEWRPRATSSTARTRTRRLSERLVWGDNKLVAAILLAEFKGSFAHLHRSTIRRRSRFHHDSRDWRWKGLRYEGPVDDGTGRLPRHVGPWDRFLPSNAVRAPRPDARAP